MPLSSAQWNVVLTGLNVVTAIVFYCVGIKRESSRDKKSYLSDQIEMIKADIKDISATALDLFTADHDLREINAITATIHTKIKRLYHSLMHTAQKAERTRDYFMHSYTCYREAILTEPLGEPSFNALPHDDYRIEAIQNLEQKLINEVESLNT